ncbi:MAG: helix-turn-helix domain-containing protein [Candidatus Rokuibacteriota bacterium]
MSNTDRLLSPRELAACAGLSRATIRRRLKDGLPSYKLGGRVLISEREFRAWLEQFRARPGGDVAAIVDSVMSRVPKGAA